ncbi:hypothetical protein ABPG72_003199 [Tetrahymena utriculariae]
MKTNLKVKEQDPIQNLKNQLKNELNRLQKAEILNNIGSLYYNQTQYKKSIEYYLQVLKILPGQKQLSQQEQEQKLVACRYISENYRKLHKYQKGLNYCVNHQELSELFKNELEIERAYCNFGQIYMDQAESFLEKNRYTSKEFEKKIDESISYFVKSQAQIKKLIDSQTKKSQISGQNDFSQYHLRQKYVESLFNQACALFVKGKWDNIYYDQSINKLKETLREADQIQYTIIKGKCYNTLGLIYLQKKEYEKANKQFLKDAEICLQNNDMSGLIDDYMNIGITNQYLKQHEESQKYYKKALKLSKENQLDEKKTELNDKLEGLAKEIELRKECEEIEKKLKRESNFRNERYQQKQIEYIDILISLEEYQKIIDHTSSALQQDQNNIKLLESKAIAEDKLKKYSDSKISYEKAIQFYQNIGKQTTDYANCLIEYANVLDELNCQVELIIQNYQEAYKIAIKLGDIYIQKVILENLDIIYETKKMKKQRIENKKLLLKLMAQYPELQGEDQSQSQNSSDSDSFDYNQDEDNDDDNDNYEIFQSLNNASNHNSEKMKSPSTQGQINKLNQKISKLNQNQQQTQRMEVEEDNQKLNISLRKKKNCSKIMEDDSDNNYEEEEDISKQQEDQYHQQKDVKINKNFFRQEKCSETKINQYQEKKNQNNKNNNNNQMLVNHKLVNPKQKILEVYHKKCQKYFISKDDNILKTLEQINNLNLKKYYQSDIKLAPFFKTIRNIDNLQTLDLSYNLLTNVSLKQLNFSKYNKNLTKLNLAYNHFYYDELFYEILCQCQELQNFQSLNLSGLRIQPSYYDQIWNLILKIRQLKVLKFKNSELDGLPKFLPNQLKESQIEELSLKNNCIDAESVDALTLLEHFREGFKVYF